MLRSGDFWWGMGVGAAAAIVFLKVWIIDPMAVLLGIARPPIWRKTKADEDA